MTCVATIAEELSGFVADDEAAAASSGASPHPLAPPRLCEHWDDVFDDVEAEAAAIASEVRWSMCCVLDWRKLRDFENTTLRSHPCLAAGG